MVSNARFSPSFVNVATMVMFGLICVPNRYKPYAIGLFALATLTSYIKGPFSIDFRKLLIDSSLYLVLGISMLYTENMEYGWRKLGTMVSLLIFPIICTLFNEEEANGVRNNLQMYLRIYVFSVVVFCVAFFLYHLAHYQGTIFQHYPTLIREGLFAMHPLYLGMQVAIALLFSYFIFKKEKKRSWIVLLIVADLLLLGFLLMLLKKGPLLFFLLTFAVTVIAGGSKRDWRIYITVLVIILGAILGIPKVNSKFRQLLNVEELREDNATSVNIRYAIYGHTIKAVQDAPFFGYGIGDAKETLIAQYKDRAPILYEDKYNSHNQYLGLVLMAGVFGLSALLLILGYNFWMTLRFDNHVLLSLLLFFGLMMLIENILEREAGVIPFAFLVGYFSILNRKNKAR